MRKFENGLISLKHAQGSVSSRLLWGVLVVGLLAGGYYYFSNKDAPEADKRSGFKNRPVPVLVGEIKKGDITVSMNALGTVIPRNTVTVYPQVSGILTNVFFKEGDMVEAGQILAQIDSRTYEASLKQALGALERDKMLLRNAETDLKRYETLIAQESVSSQIYETQKALVDQYRGSVITDQGSVDAAKLQVEFAKIVSPISGRVGLRLVDPGNLVQANNSSSLFVITQVSPTTVIFAVPQNLIGTYMQKLNPSLASQAPSKTGATDPSKAGPGSREKGGNEKGGNEKGGNRGNRDATFEGNKEGGWPGKSSTSAPLGFSSESGKKASTIRPTQSSNSKPQLVEIEAWDSENKFLIDKGRLDSIDNVIDITTGTVKLRAIFPNSRGTLFANQFVNVKSILEVKKDVIYMPATALQKGTIGTFVYRVNEDGKTVSVVPVKLGPTDEDKILVESGLNLGDKVVIDGLDKLREGANIVISEPVKPGGGKGRKGAGDDKGSSKPEGPVGASDKPPPNSNTNSTPAVSSPTETKVQAGEKVEKGEKTDQEKLAKPTEGIPDKQKNSGNWDKSKVNKEAQ